MTAKRLWAIFLFIFFFYVQQYLTSARGHSIARGEKKKKQKAKLASSHASPADRHPTAMPLRRRGVRDRVDRVVLRVDRARRVVRDGVVLHNAHVVLRLLMLLLVVHGVVVLVAGVVRGVEVAAVLRVVRHGF
eukprot:TRINITY_DN4182_c0_g1_i2.p1 TRINITY_DN4182_c0_g1~~TRINITY_DN4182_c0_g1_i2.p1  ORF type:complete len:133 (-),score=25.27 TRINITY_DN4182_c0_g1_i2:75-473(-)